MKNLKRFNEINEGEASLIKTVKQGENIQIIKEVFPDKTEQVLFEVQKHDGFVTLKQTGGNQLISISDDSIDYVLEALNKFQKTPKHIKFI